MSTKSLESTPDLREALGYAKQGIALVWSTNRRLTIVMASLTVAAALLPAAAAVVGKLIIDSVILAADTSLSADRWTALGWVLLEALVVMALLGVRRLLGLCKNLLYAELGYTVSRRIFEKSLTLDLSQYEDPKIQEALVLARRDATSRPFNLTTRLFELAQQAISLIAYVGILWAFSPLAVLAIVAGGLPLFLVELRFSGKVFRFYQSRTPEIRERSYLEQLLTKDTTAKEILQFQAGPQILERYDALFEQLYGKDRHLQVRRNVAGATLNIVSSAVFFGAKIWIVVSAIGGVLTIGAMTMYLAVFRQGQNAVSALLAALGGMWEDLLYISNLFAFLSLPVIRQGGTATGGPLPDDGLRLENVTFQYPEGDRPAVDGVSLHLPPGTRLGVVGFNGSGKTTLVKLMVGLYRPDSGCVRLDGLDLDEWDVDSLRVRFGVMFQPFAKFKMTAGENIAFGDGLRTTDEGRLQAAAAAGMAGRLVDSLPDGLQTRLTRRYRDGRELSGGQWQRLALARAFMRGEADIFILDEPTSAMDASAEAAFFDAFAARGDDRTTVLISHRLSNVKRADRIVVLDDGRVVETGTHDELIAGAGIYHDLFQAQATAYLDQRREAPTTVVAADIPPPRLPN